MSVFDDIYSQDNEVEYQDIPKVGTGMFGNKESFGGNK